MTPLEDPLWLGSASERRRQILTQLGIAFEVIVPEVDEIMVPDDPRRTVRENAVRKNRWCRDRHADRHILTADTVVAFDGRCLTKPRSPDEARSFLRMFSGRDQAVFTAVAIAPPDGVMMVWVVESTVHFQPLDDRAIDEYIRLVNPMDKAGGYNIDQHGDRIISRYEGSRTNIMGLPEEAVGLWLRGRAPREVAP